MSGYFDGKQSFYIGDFDDEMERDLIVPLTVAIRQQVLLKDGRLDFFINSNGGYASVAFTVVELMELAKAEDVVIRTIVTSAAYSGGSIVAVAGTPGYRYIAKDAKHLAHYGWASTGGDSTPTQVVRNSGYKSDFFKQVLGHYNKYCEIPDLETNLADDNWWIPAAKAKKWRMADHYIDRMPLM